MKELFRILKRDGAVLEKRLEASVREGSKSFKTLELFTKCLADNYVQVNMDVIPRSKGVFTHFHRVMKNLKERWSDDVFSGFVDHGARSVLKFLCLEGGVDEMRH